MMMIYKQSEMKDAFLFSQYYMFIIITGTHDTTTASDE